MKGIARSHWLPEPILPARNFLCCFPKKIFVSVHIYKNAKMNLVDIHSYKWFWHKCSLFRFLNWFLFSEEKEDIVAKSIWWYSAHSLDKTCISLQLQLK